MHLYGYLVIWKLPHMSAQGKNSEVLNIARTKQGSYLSAWIADRLTLTKY